MNNQGTKTRRLYWGINALLFLGILLIYGQAGGFGFLSYDDSDYVTGNPVVRAGLTPGGAGWAFTTWETGNWLPLTWLSHMLVCQLFGLQAGAHHLLNVLLHAVNSLLLFSILRRMTGALWRSAIVAALFAWHPLHVESVAWVSERKDVLSGAFFMLTLWAYERYAQSKVHPPSAVLLRRTGSPKSEVQSPPQPSSVAALRRVDRLKTLDYWLSLVFFACGLMSKSMLVTVPFLLLLLDYWPLRRNAEGRMKKAEGEVRSNWRWLVLEKVPLFVLSAGACVVTYLAQERSGAMRVMGHVPLTERVQNAAVSYVRYLGKMVWPEGLSALYPFPNELPLWQVGGALMILSLLSVLVIGRRRPQPWFFVGWFWFLGMLVPVIGLIQVGRQAIADRYTYLPFIGLFLACVWGIRGKVQSPKSKVQSPALAGAGVPQTSKSAVSPTSKSAAVSADGRLETCDTADLEVCVTWAAGFLAAGVLVMFLAMSWWQTRVWRNDLALWRRALAVTVGNAGALHNYGFALEQRGEVHEAVARYAEAVKLEPDLYEARDNLGRLLCQLGRPQEATNHLEQAVRLLPGISTPHAHLGRALVALGLWERARQEYEVAMANAPDKGAVLVDWGKALLAANQAPEAAERFGQVIQAEPGNREARRGRALALGQWGAALAAEGRSAEALQRYDEALRSEPDLPEVLNNLAWLLATAKDDQVRNGADAVRHAQRACELTQFQNPLMVGTLAAAYAEAGQFQEARTAAEKAIALAEEAGNPELAAKNRELLRLYEAGKAYREAGLTKKR